MCIRDSFLGTTGLQPLELKVNNTRALRLEPSDDFDTNIITVPNLVGGAPVNFVAPGRHGSVIGGGGGIYYFGSSYTNSISDNFGVIGGGAQNTIQSASYST